MTAKASLRRKLLLWLGLLAASLVIGGILSVGLSYFMWTSMEPAEIELSNVTPDEIAEKTDLDGLPARATHIRHLTRGWQGTEDFLYFRASRADVDAYARFLTGFIPVDEPDSSGSLTANSIPLPPPRPLAGPGRLDRDWWLPYGAKVSRSGSSDSDHQHVFVVDHPDYSEVWAYITTI